MPRSKTHRSTVTETAFSYEGSTTIDETLMAEDDFFNDEQVDVVNITTGAVSPPP